MHSEKEASKRSESYSQSRRIFKVDIIAIRAYLDEMKENVEEICTDQNLSFPKAGKHHTGVRPSFPYAIHFMLKGVTPLEAAKKYVERETGRVLMPAAESVQVAKA